MTTILTLIQLASSIALAAPSTLDVKKQGEQQVRKVVEPVLNQYCKEQCQVIHVDTEVDLAVDEVTSPGFEDGGGKATLAPASAKLKILMDENLGAQTRQKIVALLKEHLQTLDFPVDIDTKVTKFPQPASSGYRLADLRERVSRDIKSSLQSMLAQFCPSTCLLGDFEVQSEVINPEDVDYSAGQEYFQDGPAAIRVRGVKATLLTDQSLSPEERAGVVEMAKLKVSPFKNSVISNQQINFPRVGSNDSTGSSANGLLGPYGSTLADQSSKNLNSKESRSLQNQESLNRHENYSTTDSKNHSQMDSNQRQDRSERYEKIERVENGDAVQQVLEKFRVYGIVFSAIMLALLVTLVAVAFRKQVFESKNSTTGADGDGRARSGTELSASEGSLTSEEKGMLIAKRIEADRLYHELVNIYSEQPKVAKFVFTHVLTEEGVETTAQYLEIFGESVVMDLLRDPGLQSDLTELMDFYTRNAFEINDEERMQLLKKLHHRTVTAKMHVHGSHRSAALFDFLSDMDSPQIIEMIKNESATVKAIVLTQCDQKKRQFIFNSHDEAVRLKLMTELSRIDHLPKNYIYNVSTALRRKKMETPKLNTEALPGTDVLVSFLEKSSIATQRTIVHQLMGTAGVDALTSLKSKLVSLETLRFIKDQQLNEVINGIKHEEIVQFLKGCTSEVRESVLRKVSQDLSAEIRDDLTATQATSRESFAAVERKILNRIKVLSNNGQINLVEVNEQIFAEEFGYKGENTQSDLRKAG